MPSLRYPFDGYYEITQVFGVNPQMYNMWQCSYCPGHYLGGHNGVDWRLPEGTPVLAAADGVVKNVSEDTTGYGLRIILNHGNFDTLYAHLSQVFVAEGYPVKQGDRIALSGNTGHSTGPHLHFGLRFLDNQGKVINPCSKYCGWVDPLSYLVQGWVPDNVPASALGGAATLDVGTIAILGLVAFGAITLGRVARRGKAA
jgi:murein DD-endopeptidase MepM/ murein hydrolase activator NlpD